MHSVAQAGDLGVVAYIDWLGGLGEVVFAVKVDMGRDKGQQRVGGLAEFLQHGLVEAMLVFLVLPARLSACVIGAKGVLGGGAWGDQADADDGIGGGLAESGDKDVSGCEDVSDACFEIIVIRAEHVIDAELEGDNVRRVAVIIEFEVVLQVDGSLASSSMTRNRLGMLGGVVFSLG